MSTLSTQALPLVKSRLNRVASDTSLDDYLTPLIASAELELTRNAIKLQDDVDDLMLLVDYATWRYQNRDQKGSMPEWLRLRRRERAVSMKGRTST